MAGPKARQHVLALGCLVARALDAGGPLPVQRVALSQLELAATAGRGRRTRLGTALRFVAVDALDIVRHGCSADALTHDAKATLSRKLRGLRL